MISAIQLAGDALLVGLALFVERKLVFVRINAVVVIKDDDGAHSFLFLHEPMELFRALDVELQQFLHFFDGHDF